MNTFPLPASEFPPPQPVSPLWRPTPGKTYYMPLADNELEVLVWHGGQNDESRLSAGLVYKSQFRAAQMRRWLVAMGKVWRLAMLFHVESENHSYVLEPLHQKLVVCSSPLPTILPRFATKELARLALDSLSEAEQTILIEGPTWT